jgi:hypothetical protein
MMFRDAYTKLDMLEVESLLIQLNPLLDGTPFDPRNAVILGVDLPFYPGCRLLDIADHSTMPPRRIQAVYKIGSVTLLNWTNEPIYRLNEKLPIRLDEKNVVDYVRFFFTFVRGRHGRFLITESVDDIAWKEDIPPAARKAIGNLLEPVRLRGIDQDGTYILSVRMLFKDSLFKSKARVTPQGLVSLSEEELVVEDMPVLDDALER